MTSEFRAVAMFLRMKNNGTFGAIFEVFTAMKIQALALWVLVRYRDARLEIGHRYRTWIKNGRSGPIGRGEDDVLMKDTERDMRKKHKGRTTRTELVRKAHDYVKP
jgi:hypothetical protein